MWSKLTWPDRLLFSESSGFVLEIPDKCAAEARSICDGYGVSLARIGRTGGGAVSFKCGNADFSVRLDDVRKAWTTGLAEAMK